MKKITLLFLVLFAFGIYSCNESQIDSVELSELDKNGRIKKDDNVSPMLFKSIEDDQKYCGEPVECTFIAGQNIDAGSVTVTNDEEFLYVKVYSKAGFQDVSENIKMWIGLSPPEGRPSSGDFPYKVTENGDTHIFKIELSTLPEWDECGKQYVIIVHGDVLTEEGNPESGETAYGGCDLADGKPWWAYMEYMTQCCEEEKECMDAFAKKDSEDFYECVSMPIDGNTYNTWSSWFQYKWLAEATENNTTVHLYLYIKDVDDCSIPQTHVGRVEWSLADNLVDIKVKYLINNTNKDTYKITKINLYVGSVPNPYNDDGTLKPGISSDNFYEGEFVDDSSIIIPWWSGETDSKVYIIPYAEVCKIES